LANLSKDGSEISRVTKAKQKHGVIQNKYTLIAIMTERHSKAVNSHKNDTGAKIKLLF
jgi:hypothetical protein